MPKPGPDLCMVCDPDPCECFVKKPAPRKRPVEKCAPAATVEPTEGTPLPAGASRPDPRAKMKAAAQAAPPVPVRQSRPALVRPTSTNEEVLLHSALRNLKDLLHPDEMSRWSMIVNSTPTLADRSAEWRARKACNEG